MSAELSKIQPYDEDNDAWMVVVETPKHSHNKYKFDDKTAAFLLHGVLPEGMSFPYDFGFLPSTRADDGDPIDVLLLMDEPAFTGCIVPSRILGVIEAEQTESDGETERNDRVVAISTRSRIEDNCKSLKDLDAEKLREIEEFFVSYNRVRGKKFKLLHMGGVKKAEALVKDAMKKRGKASGKSKKKK